MERATVICKRAKTRAPLTTPSHIVFTRILRLQYKSHNHHIRVIKTDRLHNATADTLFDIHSTYNSGTSIRSCLPADAGSRTITSARNFEREDKKLSTTGTVDYIKNEEMKVMEYQENAYPSQYHAVYSNLIGA